jgi:hypothetical protein
MSVGGAKPFTTKSALTTAGTGYAGQLAVVTSDTTAAYNGVWESNGAGWTFLTGPPVTGTITYLNVGGVQYSAGTPAAALKTRGALTFLTGVITSTAASFVGSTSYSIATIPTAFAPAVMQQFPCVVNYATCTLTIDTTGAISVVFPNSFNTTTTPLSLWLSPCRWETASV